MTSPLRRIPRADGTFRRSAPRDLILCNPPPFEILETVSPYQLSPFSYN
jgi:hypothetical protein